MRLTATPLAAYPAETFAAWLAHVREYRGWSEKEVARRFGVAPNTVKNWRLGGAPGYVGIACHAMLKGMPAWEPSREET